ncbi:MAG: hypothetical protein WEB60_04125 [Terrimicrobiaceae bacterium]
MANAKKDFWIGRARAEALRFNGGWWLQTFLPMVFWGGLLAAVLVLASRSAGYPLSLSVMVFAGICLLLAAVLAFALARKRFLSRKEALVRLEADLRLRNALTCAEAGISEWPEPRPNARFQLDWKTRALLWQPAAALAALVVASVIPLPQSPAKESAALGEPGTWTDLQQRITELKAAEILQPEPLEELAKSLEALRAKPQEEWFSHQSLEAGDHLSASTENALSGLQKNLEMALGAMEASRQLEAAQLAALTPQLSEALQEALAQMANGALPLDEKLLAQLQAMTPTGARQLSAEEWKKLQAKMAGGISTCSNGLCAGDKAGEAVLAMLAQSGGGVSRGPGAAPLTLNEQATDLGSKSRELLKNDDLSRAAIGDLMGLGTTRHKKDESVSTAGGAMANTSPAGDSTSTLNATPSEQKVLQSFFR